MSLNLFTHRGGLAEIRRAVEGHRYDMTERGIHVAGIGDIETVGAWDVSVRGFVTPRTRFNRFTDRVLGFCGIKVRRPMCIRERDTFHNIIPLEARNKALNQLTKNAAAIATWYGALFEGNVEPGDTITGETFAAVTTEFTSYDEATRVPWAPGTVAAGAVSNSASPMTFTASSGVTNKTIYGGALLQNSAKGNATAGQLILSASQFTAPKVLSEGEQLLVVASITFALPA